LWSDRVHDVTLKESKFARNDSPPVQWRSRCGKKWHGDWPTVNTAVCHQKYLCNKLECRCLCSTWCWWMLR
jgi:hypothetical protein